MYKIVNCHFRRGARRPPSVARPGMAPLVLVSGLARGLNNGIYFDSPPLGWRSWNCYHENVDQQKIERVVDAMVRSRPNGGKSLRALGYENVGLDDNWQECRYNKYFHDDIDGTPMVNLQRFPDMKRMTDYGHARGMRMGWYENNCICTEFAWKRWKVSEATTIRSSVRALTAYGFDGVKLGHERV